MKVGLMFRTRANFEVMSQDAKMDLRVQMGQKTAGAANEG